MSPFLQEFLHSPLCCLANLIYNTFNWPECFDLIPTCSNIRGRRRQNRNCPQRVYNRARLGRKANYWPTNATTSIAESLFNCYFQGGRLSSEKNNSAVFNRSTEELRCSNMDSKYSLVFQGFVYFPEVAKYGLNEC